MNLHQRVPAAAGNVFDVAFPATDGREYTLKSLTGEKGTVVVFTANGCPTARAYEERLRALATDCGRKGILLVAINSNNPYLSPPDTLPEMQKRSQERQFNYPYLKDPDSALAQHFGAVCTPHAFLLDAELEVVYSGRIDDSRLGDNVKARDLETAIGALVDGQPVPAAETEPFGCSIVW